EPKLIIEMAVHRRFDCGRAGPDTLPPGQSREEAEQRTTGRPQRYQATGSRAACRHRGGEDGAMPDLMLQHLAPGVRYVRIQTARNGDLRAIDADRAIFAGMIHAHDARNRQRFAGRERPVGLDLLHELHRQPPWRATRQLLWRTAIDSGSATLVAAGHQVPCRTILPFASWIAFHTLYGVAGMVMLRMP